MQSSLKILILGAGAVGGYYGLRLLQAGADVQFLVRPRRAQQLQQMGLVVSGAVNLRQTVRCISQESLQQTESSRHCFDLILLSCKAYDLDAAMDSIMPAVGQQTLIVPLLNGMAHLKTLDQRFGVERVSGGSCWLAGSLNQDGEIQLMSGMHRIVFGVRAGNLAHASGSLQQLQQLFASTPVPGLLSGNILQEMWDKYVLLCSAAAMTCLMRGAVGDIMQSEDGRTLTEAMLNTCASVAKQAGHALGKEALQGIRDWLTEPGSLFTASMLRDIEAGHRTEAAHIVGDMLQRARAGAVECAVLSTAWAHLQTYEARRVAQRLPA